MECTVTDNTSRPYRLSRRGALRSLGGAGLTAVGIQAARTMGLLDTSAETDSAFAATESGQACALTPELTEGPYYVDLERVRSDITEGKPGVPLKLRTRVINTRSCEPLVGAAVDIWHADALGVYSRFGGAGAGPPGGGQTDTRNFLRGVQLADRHGVAGFETVYPGWYPGRAIHIDLKVHIGGRKVGRRYRGGHVSHTGQLFFSERITAQVAGLSPYTGSTTARTPLSQDSIYQQAGSRSKLHLTPLRRGSIRRGFRRTITLGVDPRATPSPI
jgi:protocatechuate 3,4-dioxygenase beta subunit